MQKAQIRIIFSFLILCSVGTFIYLRYKPQKNADQILVEMPENERLILADFFQELIQNDGFGHTLFGNKPISFCHYSLHPPYVTSQFTRDRPAFFVKRAKTVWEKYREFLCLKEFSLKFCAEKDFAGNNSGVCYLINRPAFLAVVNANLDLFQESLGPQTTAESLLQRIADTNESLDSVLQKNPALEGIVLGYGKHNALVYKRYIEVSNALKKQRPPPWQHKEEGQNKNLPAHLVLTLQLNRRWQIPTGSSEVTPREGYGSLMDEYQHFREQFHEGALIHPPVGPLSCFTYPRFLTDGLEEETEKIVSNYLETEKKLAEVYSSGDFLEITLKKLGVFIGEGMTSSSNVGNDTIDSNSRKKNLEP
jgi:hypothetical protein